MTHVKEIADTRLLLSASHSWASASLEVFDISRKGQRKKIYSFEGAHGSRIIAKMYFMVISFFFLATGYGDVTYNPRRSILGAIPVGGKIAYHLYNFATSKACDIVKLLRKSRWHSQCSHEEGINNCFYCKLT